jgi:hypothetical protein
MANWARLPPSGNGNEEPIERGVLSEFEKRLRREWSIERWSVRVTANYRITFRWSGEDAIDIDFEDYH